VFPQAGAHPDLPVRWFSDIAADGTYGAVEDVQEQSFYGAIRGPKKGQVTA